MRTLFLLPLSLLAAAGCSAQSLPRNAPQLGLRNIPATAGRANIGETRPPFATTRLAHFEEPFALAFLPDGGVLVTEKAGHLRARWADGEIVEVSGAPIVAQVGQGGLLDVAIAPDYATSHSIYLSYSEKGTTGAALALARATLVTKQVQCIRAPCPARASLEGLRVIWRSGQNGPGGQFGATILFAPDGRSLFLASGERQRFTPAQDPNQALGKILRLTLDGKAWPGNPDYKAGGVKAMTWSTGHRNPYGMVFTADGHLWEEEMGPRGGDELNMILPGRNYGWPIVSNGDNYSGQPIPDHPSRPDLEAPKLWWNPSISPGGMILYSGAMFPEWRGQLLIGALGGEALIRVAVSGMTARVAAQWKMGDRIRDLAQAPDGAVWLLEDGGDLVRLARR
ncbi:PQQ-dependent sugar dehydrogenase [Sphingomonas sp. 28-63-12]|uniref:PQQ-dependent sugar dehydrogenase n=1 Tax=Sphingomonas sp. 28-63-12 TaxID=1970434 RepID=UPI0035A89941